MNNTQGYSFDVFSRGVSLPIRQIMPVGGGGGGRRGNNRINVFLEYDNHQPISSDIITSVRASNLPVPVSTNGEQPFVFDDVPSGRYVIVVEVEGFDSQEKEISLRANQNVNITFKFNRKESVRMKERINEKMSRFKAEFAKKKQQIESRTDIDEDVKKKLVKKAIKEAEEDIFDKEELEWRKKDKEKFKKEKGEEKAIKEEEAQKKLDKQFFRGKFGKNVNKVIGTVALIGIGALVSGMFSSWWFMIAFMGWAAMTMVPNPDEEEAFNLSSDDVKKLEQYSQSGMKDIMAWGVMFRNMGRLSHPRIGFGFLRTIFKLTAIGFAIYGIFASDNIPFKPIALLIACFITYYSLKISYKRNMPHHFLESVLRFGFLGCWMIPYIFFVYFQSSVLGLIALAFLAIPPVMESEKPSEVESSSMMDMGLRGVFFVIMLIVLAGSGAFPFMANMFGSFSLTWGLTGALKDTFIYFWAVSLIAGLFATNETRPAMGFIMLLASTVIFGLGPGQQEVGTALFGQWYPMVQNFMSAVGTPFSQLFGTLGSTFGSTWMLLTNPIGYAQQIQNGTYVRDPATGIAGAFGVELENIHATDIYNGQPYLLMMTVKNKGAYEAKNVQLIVQPNARYQTGVPAPLKEESSSWGFFGYGTGFVPGAGAVVNIGRMVNKAFFGDNKQISMTGFGFETDANIGQTCPDKADSKTEAILANIQACGYAVGSMDRLDVQQVAFSSKNGISCPTIVDYKLMTKEKAKVMPFNIQVSYDYEIDSTMDIEFMSNNEWQRLAQLELLPQLSKKASQFKNAPVRLNIDTLEQPIREGTTFHMAFNLISAQPKSAIGNVNTVIRYPKALGGTSGEDGVSCMAAGGNAPIECGDKECTITITKDKWPANGPYVMFCTFSGGYTGGKDSEGKAGSMTKPTESFTITAHADYTFSKYQSYDTRIQFGGESCCKADENNIGEFPCPLGASAQKCENNKCVAAGAGQQQAQADTCTPNGGTCREAPDDPNTAPCQQGEKLFTGYTCPKSGSGKAQNCCKVESIPPSNESVPPTPTP